VNLQHVTIPIEPRSVGGCLDLAVHFYRVHIRQLMALLLMVAVPALGLTWILADQTKHGLFWGFTIYFFGAPIAGALIVAGAGHRIFGEPFTVRRALRTFRPHGLALSMSLVGSRILTALAGLGLVTAWLVAVRGSFLPEIYLLEQLRGQRRRRRVEELTRSTQTSPVMRFVAIQCFSLALVISFFTLIDLASNHLAGVPIWSGHGYGIWATLQRLWYDPTVVTVIMAVAWLVYPLGRMAWFFCYVDQRIRNECWDVELDFRRDARRLSS
jgi:hypothetical protein